MNIKNLSVEFSNGKVFHIADKVRLIVRNDDDKSVTVEGYISQIISICNSPMESQIKIINGIFGEVYSVASIEDIELLDPTKAICL